MQICEARNYIFTTIKHNLDFSAADVSLEPEIPDTHLPSRITGQSAHLQKRIIGLYYISF